MHIGTLRLINLANSRLWLVLSNALDASKKAENTGVSLFIQGVSFNYHHRNVRSRVLVSVSPFMTRSRSRLEIWARSRSRRLRSRLHHWLAWKKHCLASFKTSGAVTAFGLELSLWNFFLGQRPSLFHHGLILEDTNGLTSQAGLPVWLFWGQICNFWAFFNSFGLFYF